MESNEFRRSLPNSPEAESYILGSILLDNSIIRSLKGRIEPESFFNPIHQDLYTVMCKLDENGTLIEPLTVKNLYSTIKSKSGLNEDAILNHLTEIIESVPNTVYVDTYTNIIIEKAVERKLLNNMENLRKNILNNKMEYKEVLDDTEKNIYELLKNRNPSDIISIEKAANDYYTELIHRVERQGEYTGITTGYERLDRLTSGFQPGEFIIIAARPSVGKTAFALNLASQVAKKGNSVAFFSLEMSINQIMQRMYCMQSMIDADKLKNGLLNEEEKVSIGVARHQLESLNIYFDESGSNTIGDIRAKCRQLKHKNQLDFLIIDYLQLINNDDRKNRQEEVSQISRSLKQLSRELNIPVIALSQLSRSIETREDKRPVLADLRESGSLEQDADIVMFLFRRSDIEQDTESNFEDETVKKTKDDENIRRIILKIEKNRQGSLGHIDFEFYGAQSKYSESAIQEELEYKKKKKKKSTN